MKTTKCLNCGRDIEYPDEDYDSEKPDFCSTICSRTHFREHRNDDGEWYE